MSAAAAIVQNVIGDNGSTPFATVSKNLTYIQGLARHYTVFKFAFCTRCAIAKVIAIAINCMKKQKFFPKLHNLLIN